MYKDRSVRLGQTVRDPITGLQGIAMFRTIWMFGCSRIGIQPVNKDGLTVQPPIETFDEPQLIVVDDGIADRVRVSPVPSLKLGQRAKDIISGVTGIIVAFEESVHGTTRLIIQPPTVDTYQVDEDSRYISTDNIAAVFVDNGVRDEYGMDEPELPLIVETKKEEEKKQANHGDRQYRPSNRGILR